MDTKNEKLKDAIDLELAMNHALSMFPDLLDSIGNEKVSKEEKIAVMLDQLVEKLIESMAENVLQEERSEMLKKQVKAYKQVVKMLKKS